MEAFGILKNQEQKKTPIKFKIWNFPNKEVIKMLRAVSEFGKRTIGNATTVSVYNVINICILECVFFVF